MAVTQYIGSRYVPVFAEPIEWSAANTYEPLTIVIHEGNSYTSKQAVPKDIDISNEAFWALTGNYNAQVELYRRETATAQTTADDAQADATAAQTDIDTLLPKAAFASDRTVKDLIDGAQETADNNTNAIDLIKQRMAVKAYYKTIADMISDTTLEPGDIVIVMMQSAAKFRENMFIISDSAPIAYLPKAKGVYRLANNLYATIMNHESSQLPTPPNTSTVAAMAEVAESYVAQKDNFTYGDPTHLWHMSISCSVLSLLIAMGIPFDDSPYVRPTGTLAIGQAGYGYPIYEQLPATQNETFGHPAGLLAQWAAINGFGYVPDAQYNNVCPGDVLFFTDEHATQNEFLGIIHCETVLALPSRQGRAERNKRFVTANAGFTSGYPVRYYDRQLPDSQTPVYGMRLPLNNGAATTRVQMPSESIDKNQYQCWKPTGFDSERTHLLSVCGEVIPTSDDCVVQLIDAADSVILQSGFYNYGESEQFYFNRSITGVAGTYAVNVINGYLKNVSHVFDSVCDSIVKTDYLIINENIANVSDFINYLKGIDFLTTAGTFYLRLSNSPTFLTYNDGAGIYECHYNNRAGELLIKKIAANTNVYETCINTRSETETFYRRIQYTAM